MTQPQSLASCLQNAFEETSWKFNISKWSWYGHKAGQFAYECYKALQIVVYKATKGLERSHKAWLCVYKWRTKKVCEKSIFQSDHKTALALFLPMAYKHRCTQGGRGGHLMYPPQKNLPKNPRTPPAPPPGFTTTVHLCVQRNFVNMRI